ncbi:TonB-dependent siderophore receptor [Novosphingobium beihaiensis]|uniref:TonB-dependent siderophore receptor n=1 Tax=Novosphingobium beihaiensis TaxID=2930389 RepID=A0ABT0BVZ8_9SPHN|nr:TonB-dependent siderophore receptor [Novosphingobium beihaiensis]MCJ2188819.1 TonB-dependent siderophore receptor [Novosphingobium beihaiensis]
MLRANGGSDGKPIRMVLASALLATNALAGPFAPAALAQKTSATQGDFRIAAQPLGDALVEFGRQSGLEVTADPALIAGKRSAEVSGRLAPGAALSRLLAGTGLTFRFISATGVTLEPAPQASGDGTIRLGPVRVEGADGPGKAVYAADLITENSPSYTSKAVTIGSKVPRSLRETPATVTVLTRERIEDAGLFELKDILAETPGITVTSYNSQQPQIQSRGFLLQDIRVDGLPISNDAFTFFDLAQYDHIEVLRGVDGLYGSNGQPSGAVNLSRKRALSTPKYALTLSAGSWNNYRAEADITGPLNESGTLRARAVGVYHNRDFFYDTANREIVSLYGRLEWDATPDTMIALGGAYETHREHGYGQSGLMRYQTGEDLKLPRSTSFATDFSHWDHDTAELFASVEQALGDDWKISANGAYRTYTRDISAAYVFGGLIPDTHEGALLASMSSDLDKDDTYSFAANISGSFELFGQSHDMVFGGEYRHRKTSSKSFLMPGSPPPVDIFDFDPGAWDAFEIQRDEVDGLRKARREDVALYGSVRLNPTDQLHLVVGGRYTDVEDGTFDYDPTGTDNSFVLTRLFTSKGDAFTPNAALIWDFTDQLSLYGSYAKLRQFPSGVTVQGNPLSPTNGRNLEIGVKGAFRDGRLNASIAAYQIDRTDVPVYAGFTVGSQSAYNVVGKQRSRGVEMDVSGELVPNVQISAGYTYNKNDDLDADQQYSTATPKHMLRLWASYTPIEKLQLAGGINWQSSHFVRGTVSIYKRNTTPPEVIRTESFDYTQPAYAVVNARVAYALFPNISLSANLNNLFDKTYYATVGSSSGSNWYGEPRNVLVKLRAEF